jgi:hypothetical protein
MVTVYNTMAKKRSIKNRTRNRNKTRTKNRNQRQRKSQKGGDGRGNGRNGSSLYFGNAANTRNNAASMNNYYMTNNKRKLFGINNLEQRTQINAILNNAHVKNQLITPKMKSNIIHSALHTPRNRRSTNVHNQPLLGTHINSSALRDVAPPSSEPFVVDINTFLRPNNHNDEFRKQSSRNP